MVNSLNTPTLVCGPITSIISDKTATNLCLLSNTIAGINESLIRKSCVLRSIDFFGKNPKNIKLFNGILETEIAVVNELAPGTGTMVDAEPGF